MRPTDPKRVRIADPCPMRWSQLDGEDPLARTCAACDREVVNLSAMTQDEAAAFLAGCETACVTYVADTVGGPRFLPRDLAEIDRALLVLSALAAAGGLAWWLWLAEPAQPVPLGAVF